MGTDYAGQDLFIQLIYGTHRSVEVGLLAGLMSVAIGVGVGLWGGYFGGWIDETLMRFTDLFIITPSIVLAIVLASVLGPSLNNIILAIAVTSWMSTARIMRSDILSLKARPFLESARISGAEMLYLLRRHILPNEIPMITSNTLLAMSGAVLVEAGLSFLGIGDLTDPSWGITLYYADLNGTVVVGAWWNILFPGLFIVLFVVSLVLLGRGLERISQRRIPRLK